ncbi:MAG TPA: enoyl-CoA hydratase-related protein, partial [Gordonia sp. (in: high G+C Gram-positive bacteria)]|nr:enoyl-CoA hydratase-related protein [Gordonia sp. (in: high G+C Gram-positive bacteria)]
MTASVSTDAPHCLVEKRGHVLIVTLNRPQARNALSLEMMATMREAWDQVDADPDIRVAILTGAGGSFCAGMDLKAMRDNAPGDTVDQGTWNPASLPALLKGRRLTKPL